MKLLHIGDLHFGEKGNSTKFNNQVIEFLVWATKLAKDQGVDYIIQHGDYYHTRHKIDVSSLDYGLAGAEFLSEQFGKDKVIVLKGNHDLYYLERLDVSSVNALKQYVTVVEDQYELSDDVLIVPWVCSGEMWDDIVNKSDDYDYLLGHFELNGFKVNDGYAMEHGFSPNALKKYKRVITGHYHSKQTKGNVTYLGTPYPITMNEANEDHGVYILDTDTDEFEFHCYDRVKVLSVPVDEFLDNIDSYDVENTSIRVEFPDDLDDESVIDEVRETLTTMGFTDAKVKYNGKKTKEILDAGGEEVEEVENIDQSVISSIKNSTDVSGVSRDKLETFYNMAIERGQE